MHDSMMPLDADVGSHAVELGCQHEAVLKHILCDDGVSCGSGEKCHGLGLHVGRKAGVRQRLDVRRFDGAGAPHGDAIRLALDGKTHKLVLLEHETQMLGVEPAHGHRLAHQAAHGDEGTCLDAVAHHPMAHGMQLRHALDLDERGAGARDLGAHLVEHVGQVYDLRLASSIVDGGDALGVDRGHQQVLCSAHRGKLQRHQRSHDAIGRTGVDIAVIYHKVHTQRLKAQHMHIDLAGADVAATRHSHHGLAKAGQKRSQHRRGCAHLGHQMIGSDPGIDVCGVD